ncbi:MAG: hypothetical protein H0U65_01770 [Rubrobacter sp.]|nr:hypothetical protein [Rubrobacter sp.]
MAKQTKTLSKGAHGLLAANAEDHLDLWELLWTVEAEEDLEDNPEAAREAGRRVVSELVKGGYIHAGIPKGRSDFIPWPLSADEAIERIEREWKALGREPDISEVAWFDITEKGRAYLAREKGGAG